MHIARPAARLSAFLACMLIAVIPEGAEATSYQLTHSELAAESVVVLAEWVDGEPPRTVIDKRPGCDDVVEESVGRATFRIVRTREGASDVAVGQEIAYPRHVDAKKGDRFLLVRDTIDDPRVPYWSASGGLSDAGFDYIAKLPALDEPAARRLEYFVRFLEFNDPQVAADAFTEFERASYADIVAITDKLPRHKLRKWVAAMDPRKDRQLELYGGLCGDASDAELLRKRIVDEPRASDKADFRVGIGGMMDGYLLLAGEKGLAVLEREFLSNRHVHLSETYAAMQAVHFMWEHGGGKIGKERLRESMRLLLDHPDLVDFAIAYLTRWKDWSVRDHVLKLYGAAEFDIPPVKRAIIRYFLLCARDVSADAKTNPPHVAEAKRRLEDFRRRDPQLVADVERLLDLE
ncbi:MAG: hypothetical protein WD069_14740 [Planctomycetales bacterium]